MSLGYRRPLYLDRVQANEDAYDLRVRPACAKRYREWVNVFERAQRS